MRVVWGGKEEGECLIVWVAMHMIVDGCVVLIVSNDAFLTVMILFWL